MDASTVENRLRVNELRNLTCNLSAALKAISEFLDVIKLETVITS